MDQEQLALRAWASSFGTGEWRRAKCPFCPLITGKEDRRGNLSINGESGYYECWRCHTSGWLDGVESWAPQETVKVEKPTELRPPEGFVRLGEEPGLSALSTRRARRYLESRGLPPATWRDAGIGAVLRGYYAERIVVPIFDDDDRTWLGWVGRLWRRDQPGELRYAYPRGMQRRSILFDRYLLDEETRDPLLVVEGVMDALPYLGRAIAVLGKPSHQHVEMLAKAQRPLAIALDGDAHFEGLMLARRLRLRGVEVGAVRLPPSLDPNTVNPRALLQAARRCIGRDRPAVLEE
jgi:hypothetical protein